MGVSYEKIRELAESKFCPVLTPEKAFDRYAEYVKIQLRWFKDSDAELPIYRLRYEPTTARPDDSPLGIGRNRELRYIDACR